MENTKTTDNSKLNYFLFFFFMFHTVCIHDLCGPRGLSVCCLCLGAGIRCSSWIVALSSRFYGAFAFISQYVEPFQHPDETSRSV